MNHTGSLYVVATPIGNLSDISARAIECLRDVDVIACEDTRHSQRLLVSCGISAKCIALHDHNEESRVNTLLEKLRQGLNIALISDAGTPLISDPGYKLVHALKLAGVSVIPIPGPCALIAALCASGLPTDRFAFWGFLPAKSSGRKASFAQIKLAEMTTIFYESSHRILASLDDAIEILGDDWPLALAKEMTKTFEHIELGTLGSVKAWLNADSGRLKGEFVLLFQAKPKDDFVGVSESALDMLRVMCAELPIKQAAKLVSDITGENKNALYKVALGLASHPK